MEPLLEKDVGILKPTDYNYSISFIGAAMEMDPAVIESIRSMNRIGEELGRDFEIVLVHRAASDQSKEAMRTLKKTFSNIVFLESNIETIGQGKSIAFDYATGKYVVPFNTIVSYPVRYSDVLHDFLRFKLKRLYFSELSIMSREIVNEVGGWRNLSSGEDIDLYSRLAINYGVFACPTKLIEGEDRLSRELLSIRAFPGSVSGDFKSSYPFMRDLIISCNHTFSDVRDISRILRDAQAGPKGGLFTFAYLGSRISHIKPISYNRNNFVILMESILESLILREYLKMPDVNEEVSWHIDNTHLSFLKSKSKMFTEMKDSTALFLDHKN